MYNLHQTDDPEEQDEESNNLQELSEKRAQSHRRIDELQIVADDQQRTHGPSHSNGDMDIMEDSSDSEGEDEEHVTKDSSQYYPKYSTDKVNQSTIGKLSDHHPYYANTGAIPKGSASSLPENPTKEIVKADVHASAEPQQMQRWPSSNRYDPRSNKHFLYDVQEVEPSYGDVAPSLDADGRVRDSGCSEGSSQTEICDIDDASVPASRFSGYGEDTSADHDVMQTRFDANSNHRNTSQGLHSTASVYEKQQIDLSRSNSRDFVPANPNNYFQENKNMHFNGENPHEAATYLDMDRYAFSY